LSDDAFLCAFAPLRFEKMKLSPREKQVLQRMASGETVPMAAHHLQISPHTANHYLRRAYAKLAVHNATEAVAKALTTSDPQLSLSLR
jgi:DNA-binding NarL/FixJ family response regulator